jgi:hypothetical protein
MNHPQTSQHAVALALGLFLTAAAPLAQSQVVLASTQAPASREQVKMDRDQFLKYHTWDVRNEMWTLKPGYEAPMGVKPRTDVTAERDMFLSRNRWDTVSSRWVPVGPTPRVMSSLTREQVRAETDQFLATHEWQEEAGVWAPKAARSSKQ